MRNCLPDCPLNVFTTSLGAIVGGTDANKWTWSGMTSTAKISHCFFSAMEYRISFSSSWWPSRIGRRYFGIQTICKFKIYLECRVLFNFFMFKLYHKTTVYATNQEVRKQARGNMVFTFIPGLKPEVFPFTSIK